MDERVAVSDAWREALGIIRRYPFAKIVPAVVLAALADPPYYFFTDSGFAPDRSFSSLSPPRGRSPDRLAAVLTVAITKAAAKPQITPITAPESRPPVHHHTPRLTSKDTATRTIADNTTVPAILAIILISFAYSSLRSFSPR
jgi:hypothetical protein